MTRSSDDVDAFWVVTMADGIEPARLAAVLRSWDVSGIDGILVVHGANQEVAFKPKVVPKLRLVQPAASVSFNRATWRNIAVRFAPCQYVAFWDADCALVACDGARVAAGAREALVTGTADFVVFAPQWSSQDQANRYLLGDLAAIEGVGAQNPTATWAGTCALSRELAIEVSWDDEQQGWGYQDADFCARVQTARPALQLRQALPGLVHLWHPVRGKSKQSKAANLRRALLRRSRSHEKWEARAHVEIAMLIGSVAFESAQQYETEAALRRAFTEVVRSSGWPVLRALGAGRAPAECIYWPVLGATVTDVKR